MKNLLLLLLSLSLSLPAFAEDCAPAKGEAELRAAIARFDTAFRAGDVEAMMQSYAPELVYMPDGLPTDSGLEPTRQALQSLFDAYEPDMAVSLEEVSVCGSLGFSRGAIRLTLDPKDGGDRRVVERRFLEIWKKLEGEWKIVRAMSNSAGAS